MHIQSTYLAILATLTVTTWAQTDCTQDPTNFRLYSPEVNQYAALGGPCRKATTCGVFFSVDEAAATTYFNLTTSTGLLTIAAATSGPASHPDLPAGFLANTPRRAGKFSNVYFNSHSQYKTVAKSRSKLNCQIVASSSGDGTCDLVCSVPGRGGQTLTGFSVQTNNFNQLYLGDTSSRETIAAQVIF